MGSSRVVEGWLESCLLSGILSLLYMRKRVITRSPTALAITDGFAVCAQPSYHPLASKMNFWA